MPGAATVDGVDAGAVLRWEALVTEDCVVLPVEDEPQPARRSRTAVNPLSWQPPLHGLRTRTGLSIESLPHPFNGSMCSG